MNLKLQKKLAASVLGVGVKRVRFDEKDLDKISQAITKDDMRALESHGHVTAKQKKGVSRVRARYIQKQKAKGRRRGPGSRSGRKFSRVPSKRYWINKIRPLRRKLKELKSNNMIEVSMYRKLYLLAKGNFFRDSGHLMTYLKDHEIIKEV